MIETSDARRITTLYSDIFELPLPARHRFPIEKYRLLRERLQAIEFRDLLEFYLSDAATDRELLLVHTPDYVEKLKQGTLSRMEERRIGFPWSPALVERSRRSTGATIGAARAALRDGAGVHLAGGTHHAFPDHGQGFCVFNDVAVAARNLLANGNDQLLIGRLPSKTLGTRAFRDSSGNCLWYAVSAAFKASNASAPGYVPSFNWDTLGDFETALSSDPHERRALGLAALGEVCPEAGFLGGGRLLLVAAAGGGGGARVGVRLLRLGLRFGVGLGLCLDARHPLPLPL